MKNRLELVKFFEKNRLLGRGAEIGSYKGDFAKQILENWNGDLFLIDVWRELDQKDYDDMSNQVENKNIFSACIDNITNFENRCFMIRSDSKNAVQFFENESLDFAYIDANHKYDYVKEDIELWFPKIRKGGILAGHDYLLMNWYDDPNFAENKKDKYIWMNSLDKLSEYNKFAGVFGVNPAVDEFCAKYNLNLKITTDEWFGSWFIVK